MAGTILEIIFFPTKNIFPLIILQAYFLVSSDLVP